ncbi:phage major capsid protein [Antrihabitans cavernicola]|uniref:Phage major capsid protein n=1 Tax=Antrihabitans cavernicola TaxID=2495913 RepID=A0A5A7S6Q5_9NOCA|nr:phage major capsid protein [Spelaeibacter cavernicola]KAA0021810.1 phage major capsid protein [Spelaeibacter cavernicola]
MSGFANVQGRADLTDAQIPEAIVKNVIETLPEQSALIQRARNVRMGTKKTKQPVLASLPDAYWVDGDTGLKQTTKTGWENVTMTAEELAVIVPIPDALVSDSNVPLWDEIKPLLTEAIGKKVDGAGIFGVDKPASWPTALVPGAIAMGNTVAESETADIGENVAFLGEKLSKQGFAINGFASRPGLQWKMVGLRNAQGVSIYTPAQGLAAGLPSGLYGLPLNEVRNGAWKEDAATLVAADWSKVVVGIRQDVTFDMFSEGVISDADGKVILNLMQQDSKALRVVFRVGFQIANPLNRVETDKTKRYPAAVITPDLTP